LTSDYGKSEFNVLSEAERYEEFDLKLAENSKSNKIIIEDNGFWRVPPQQVFHHSSNE
jgi:hypothetical protein